MRDLVCMALPGHHKAWVRAIDARTHTAQTAQHHGCVCTWEGSREAQGV